MKFYLIIPASGDGKRFNRKIPKQFFILKNKEIITHTISKFHNISYIDEIIIATKKEYFNKIKKIIKKNKFEKVKYIVEGGKERQDSVFNSLKLIECDKKDFIIIHDAVRPFISKRKILELIKNAIKYKNVVPYINSNDTIKILSKRKFVDKTIDRKYTKLIQTPQIFRYDNLIDAFQKGYNDNFYATDESGLLENYGHKVKAIEGEQNNIKITSKKDLEIFNYEKYLN